MGSSNSSTAKAPAYEKQSYSAFGNSGNQDGFQASPYNKSQMDWVENVTPKLQSQIYDQEAGDADARNFADNQYNAGLKRFKKTSDETYGGYISDSAKRFGTLSNSSFDSGMKRFGQSQKEGMQELSDNYDANYYARLNDRQGYLGNLLSTASGTGANLYNMASGFSQNALANTNAYNGYRLNAWNAEEQMKLQQQQLKNQQWQAVGNAAMRIGAAYATGGASEVARV